MPGLQDVKAINFIKAGQYGVFYLLNMLIHIRKKFKLNACYFASAKTKPREIQHIKFCY